MPSRTHGLDARHPNKRQRAMEQRRQAILDAGLQVFAANGFAAARLDDVAAKAGVAKGTIYLSFKDKEDLFEQIVLGAVAPVLAQLKDAMTHDEVPTAALLTKIFEIFRTEILDTHRKEILRLVIAEGARFPKIAKFYHREVVAKGIDMMRAMTKRAHTRGEMQPDALAKFPHLVFAPLLLAVVWDGVFERIEPLDVEGMLAVHTELLLGRKTAGRRSK